MTPHRVMLSVHSPPPSKRARCLDSITTPFLCISTVSVATSLGLFRLRLRQVIGLVLGFPGAAILIWDGRVTISISGIGLALLSGASWAVYCIFRLTWKQPVGSLMPQRRGDYTVPCARRAFDARTGEMP